MVAVPLHIQVAEHFLAVSSNIRAHVHPVAITVTRGAPQLMTLAARLWAKLRRLSFIRRSRYTKRHPEEDGGSLFVRRPWAGSERDGKKILVGDCDFASCSAVAGAITPVPGGVGPMTIACLLRNTVKAACGIKGIKTPEM